MTSKNPSEPNNTEDKIEAVLLEFGNRVLDVRNGKENPTLGDLIDTPTQSLTQLLQEARKQGYEAGEAVGIETGKTIQLAEPSSPPELTNKGKDNHE